MTETVIKFENVSKQYRLGAIGGGTLRGDIQSFMARIKGKEDPNVKIGEDIYKKNEKFLALDGIDFEVNKSDTLGIIGHNGAGKSTMLKLLSRVTAPTTGKIYFNGRIASMLEVGTGFHPELTGRENVYLNGAILGMTKAEISRKFDEIVTFAEMERFIDTPVKRYSSGMYVKLAFAVAAHLDSEILVMDEVLAVGDMKFQQKCLGKMGDVADNEGRTVLYVSHNMNTIRQLCNRCLLLDHGKIKFNGGTEEAIELYMNKEKKISVLTDLTGVKRESRANKKVLVESVELMSGKECVLQREEKLQFKLNFVCSQSVEDVFLRATVYFSDDTVIGMTTTSLPMNFCEGDKLSKIFEINTNILAPGRYRVKMVLYRVNEYGTQEFSDIIDEACSFEKDDDKVFYNNIQWEHKWWGHCGFDAIEIIGS